MFIMDMPREFNPGDTAEVKINFEPKRLHYTTDGKKLVILPVDTDEPADERPIFLTQHGKKLTTFYCNDSKEDREEITGQV